MKNDELNIESFEIIEEQLYFEGKSVLEGGQYPFNKFVFIDKIGEGANGVTFKVFHKILQMDQVVKISRSNYQKNLLEAIKNSSTSISDVIAAVSDAGILGYPANTSYSVMPLINNSISFSDWISCRDKLLRFCNEYFEESSFKSNSQYSGQIIQSSLNLSISLLSTYSKFIKNNIIHGDLNPNNILIKDSVFNAEVLKSLEEYFKYQNGDRKSSFRFDCAVNRILATLQQLRRKVSVGTITSSFFEVKFIDLGTSQLETTNRDFGEQRDVYFILDSARRLLKPFFNGTSLNNFLNLEKVNGDLLLSFNDPSFDDRCSRGLEKKFGVSNLVKNGRLTPEAIHLLEESGPMSASYKSGLPIGKYYFIFYNGNLLSEYLINEWLLPYPIFSNNEEYEFNEDTYLIDESVMFFLKYNYQGNVSSSMVSGDVLRLVAFLNIIFGYSYQNSEITTKDYEVIGKLNGLINPPTPIYNVEVDIRNLDTGILDAKFIEAWENLIVSEDKFLSLGVLIQWENLWNQLSFTFSNTIGASDKVFKSMIVQGSVFSFNVK